MGFLALGRQEAAPRQAVVSARVEERPSAADFAAIYEEHFAFVWRSAKRLGIPDASLDDVVQETFVVVHRRLGEFEGRSSLKTWIFGVLRFVVNDHRRSHRRKGARGEGADPDEIGDQGPSPHEVVAQQEARDVLKRILDELDDDKREVFVLAELEQMSMPEIAEAIGGNVNTLHAKLRAARQEVEKAVARVRAKDGWRFL